jgi:transcriptional regulator with XRE-family HTH domain
MAEINDTKAIQEAQQKLNASSKEQVKILKEVELLEERIKKLRADKWKSAQKELEFDKEKLKVKKEELEKSNENIKQNKINLADAKRQKAIQDETVKGLQSFGKVYANMNPLIAQQLNSEKSKLDIFASIKEEAIRQQATVKFGNKEEKEAASEKLQIYNEITDSLEDSAKQVAESRMRLLGKNDIEIQKEYIKNNNRIKDEEKERLYNALELQEALNKKTERYKEISEQSSEIMDVLPQGLQSMVKGAQKFATALKLAAPELLLLGVIALAVEEFVQLDEAAETFRKNTGYTSDQFKGLQDQVHNIQEEYRKFGVTAEQVYDVTNELKNEFSDITQFSKESAAALTVMKNNLGIQASDAAKVQAVFEEVGGLAQNAATSVAMQVSSMAKMAGVSPKEVLEDIAKSSEITSKFFKGDVNLLKQQVIEAHRLGTDLEKVSQVSENLLNFEEGIADELTAATFVGGQFNLSRARALAMEGKIVDAQNETLDQIQRSGDFRKQDYFTQRQLAKAAGMSIQDINKQLTIREKLANLSEEEKKTAQEAIAAGLDVTDLSKEQIEAKTKEFAENNKIQGQVTDLSNAFKGIVATVGGVLTPLLQIVGTVLTAAFAPIQFAADMFGKLVGYIKESTPLLATILAITTAIAVQKGIALAVSEKELIIETAKSVWKQTSLAVETAINAIKKRGLIMTIVDAAMAAYKSVASIPYIGWALGAGAAAGALTFGYSQMSKAADVNSPADGKTQISTKEGGLYELSPNDDLVAAPGASKAMSGGNGGGNLATLTAPLNAMIGELKALRADLTAGKVAVYMDGVKLTNGIGKQAERSTRNGFNMSQA